MHKQQLTHQIRRHEVQQAIDKFNSLDDDTVIEGAATCQCCGEQIIEREDLELMIANAQSVDHFYLLLAEHRDYQQDVYCDGDHLLN